MFKGLQHQGHSGSQRGGSHHQCHQAHLSPTLLLVEGAKETGSKSETQNLLWEKHPDFPQNYHLDSTLL